jgi:hypothetical protein
MLQEDKGIYPNWVTDSDIINQVLKEILQQGGRLPYSYVINKSHKEEIQERMKRIIDTMCQEKLIVCPDDTNKFIEIDIEGSMALQVGYRRYKRAKRWEGFRNRVNLFSLFFIMALILAIIGGVIYLLLHYFKIM